MKSQIVAGKLQLQYQLAVGTDKSHGIEVAESCGLKHEIIHDAKEWEKIRRYEGNETTGNGTQKDLIAY
jgi:DNA mismatch repair ATPase MutS